MLRFVNCKLDLILENSRRLISNPNVSLVQQCQRFSYGAVGRNVTKPAEFRHETSTLVPCLTPNEVDWKVCRVKNMETNLESQHQMIYYKDLYECYLQRLRQLYEALNALSISNRNSNCLQSPENTLEKISDVLSNDKVYDVEEIINTIDNNLKFSFPKKQSCQYWLEGGDYNVDSLRVALANCDDNNLFSNSHYSIIQNCKLPINYSKQLMCTGTDEPTNQGKDLKDNKGPSQDQLNAMQERLVECFPKILSEKHDFSIYTKDIEFAINWYPDKSYSTRGTVNYAIEIARLRLFVHIRLANIKMTLLKVTNHSDDGSIKVRWRVTGISHSEALWKYFSIGKKETDHQEWLDGFSTFYLNTDGLIIKHCMDRVVPENENVKNKSSVMERLGLKIRLPLPT